MPSIEKDLENVNIIHNAKQNDDPVVSREESFGNTQSMYCLHQPITSPPPNAYTQ